MKKYLLLAFLGVCSVVYAQDIRVTKFRNEVNISRRNTTDRGIFRNRNMYGDGRQAQLWLRVFAEEYRCCRSMKKEISWCIGHRWN